MIRRLLALAAFAVTATCSHAQPALPTSFHAKTIHSPEGADIFVRWGGAGPVVVLIHGYAENSDSWAPLAADLMKDHTVVVPDLRGIGKSSKPEGGYDKKTQAKDIRAVVTALGYDKTFVVAHDIGNMVAYAYAATYPDKVERLVVMDAPIPGIGPWDEIRLNPGVWHFNFHGPDAERLVAGRERIYFDRIWNDFTGDPSKPDEATRNFFAATYAQPGRMRAGFAQFTAFSQDAADNKNFEKVKLTMPVLAVGGEKSFGPLQAVIMRNVATNVQEAVVAGSGHWLMEERPAYTTALIRKFIDGPPMAAAPTAVAAGQKTVSFPTEDGGLIFADVYGEGGRAVVLAHGGRFNKESWEKQATALAAAGFRVLALDFRGYGKSKGPGDSQPMDAPLHLDVLGAVRYLRTSGAKTVSIVGGSMGGGAAGDASIASQQGEIDRVVFLGASPNGPAEKLKCASLFIVARDDASGDGPRLPGIRAQYEKAPQPKQLIILDGSAHAQFLFQTDQAERVMREILQFLSAK